MHSLPVRFPVAATALTAFALVPSASVAAPVLASWPAVADPSPGPALVFGSAGGGGCIAGAISLPPEGTGYQAVDLSRRRHYGHPALISFIGDLGRAVAAHDLGTMLVGDLAQPRGGPMASGHVSHQGGLDVDIWFRLDVAPAPRAARESIPQPSVIDAATGRPDPRRWTDRHAELIRLAASDPAVARVFVGAAIKRDLCARPWTDRGWLRLVRPWPGHDDHLHVRLRCPPGSPRCVDQPALPATDGCDRAEIAVALAREQATRRRPPPIPRRVLPAACGALLTAVR